MALQGLEYITELLNSEDYLSDHEEESIDLDLSEEPKKEEVLGEKDYLVFPLPIQSPIHCNVCNEIFKLPIIGFPCGCTFCNDCKTEAHCPSCLRWVEHQVVNKSLQMTIESMRLRCANYYDEPERPRQTHERCPCYLTFEEKESHEKTCEFEWKLCKHTGCEEALLGKDVESHEAQCKHAELICPVCGEEVEEEIHPCATKTRCGLGECDWFGFTEYVTFHRENCLFKQMDEDDKRKAKFARHLNKRRAQHRAADDYFDMAVKQNTSPPKRDPRRFNNESLDNSEEDSSISSFHIQDNMRNISLNPKLYTPQYSSSTKKRYNERASSIPNFRSNTHFEGRHSSMPRYDQHHQYSSKKPSSNYSQHSSYDYRGDSQHRSFSPAFSTTSSVISPTSSITSPPSSSGSSTKPQYSFDLRLMKFLRSELPKSSLPFEPDGSVDVALLPALSSFKRWHPTVNMFIEVVKNDRRRYGLKERNGKMFVRAKYKHTFAVE